MLTIEIVGEYLGIDTEKGLHPYFELHIDPTAVCKGVGLPRR